MNETVKINGKDVPVIDYIKTEDGTVPLVDIKLMSDETSLQKGVNNGKGRR